MSRSCSEQSIHVEAEGGDGATQENVSLPQSQAVEEESQAPAPPPTTGDGEEGTKEGDGSQEPLPPPFLPGPCEGVEDWIREEAAPGLPLKCSMEDWIFEDGTPPPFLDEEGPPPEDGSLPLAPSDATISSFCEATSDSILTPPPTDVGLPPPPSSKTTIIIPTDDPPPSTSTSPPEEDTSKKKPKSKSPNDDPNKSSNRCQVCHKKLGLTGGTTCRCGGLFCPLHRYSDTHNCPFDYHQLGAEEIRKNNPVVVGEKINKI